MSGAMRGPVLVLVRHQQSTWNESCRFTGWWDADLTGQGEIEARAVGRLLDEAGLRPEVLHTSLLTSAVRTADLALEAMNRVWLPVRHHWRLNERHYGNLTGLDKDETRVRQGTPNSWRGDGASMFAPYPTDRGNLAVVEPGERPSHLALPQPRGSPDIRSDQHPARHGWHRAQRPLRRGDFGYRRLGYQVVQPRT